MFLYLILVLAMLPESDAFFKRKKVDPQTIYTVNSKSPKPSIAQPGELGLVGDAGHYLWTYISSCRLYVWALTGYSLDEKLTVYGVSILCNVLYCLLVLIGFYFLPRDFMLLVGLFTCTIGPSLVLFVLGFMALSIAFMAFYPMYTVAFIWLFNFARSQFMQRLGLMLKLDIDGDGTVNWSDALAWAGKTKWGSKLGLKQLHEQMSSRRKQSLVEFIAQCIERQEDKIVKHIERILGSSSPQSLDRKESYSALSNIVAESKSELGQLPESSNSSTLEYAHKGEYTLSNTDDDHVYPPNAFPVSSSETSKYPSDRSTVQEVIDAWKLNHVPADASLSRRQRSKRQRRATLPATFPAISLDHSELARWAQVVPNAIGVSNSEDSHFSWQYLVGGMGCPDSAARLSGRCAPEDTDVAKGDSGNSNGVRSPVTDPARAAGSDSTNGAEGEARKWPETPVRSDVWALWPVWR